MPKFCVQADLSWSSNQLTDQFYQLKSAPNFPKTSEQTKLKDQKTFRLFLARISRQSKLNK